MARFGVSIAVTEESTEQRGEYPELPAGIFKIEISAAEVRRSGENTSDAKTGFKTTLDVIEPEELSGRKIFNYYNLVHPNSTTQDIGQQDFSCLRRAIGLGDVEENMEDQDVIDEMRLVPFVIKYGMGKDSKKKNPDGTPVRPAEMKILQYFYPDKDDAPPIGVTADRGGTPANDNKPTARVVAKPATVAAKPAGSKPWQKAT